MEAGDDDSLMGRCAFHRQQLSLICRALERDSIAESDVDEIKEMLDCLLEVPCGPGEIAERYDASYDEIYAVVSLTSGGSTTASCPPEAEPTVLQSTIEIMRALDFAETKVELETAIEAAATDVSDQRVAEAMVTAQRKLAAKKNEGVAAAVLPTAERSRMPDIGSQLEAGAQSTAHAQEETGHGRTVMNHSTHCEGLLAVMRRLEKNAQVKTVVPGALHQVDAHVEKFQLQMQREPVAARAGQPGRGGRGWVEPPDGHGRGRGRGQPGRGGRGWIEAPHADEVDSGKIKLVARKGKTAQDVTIVLKHGLKLDFYEIHQLIDDAVEPPRAEEPSSSYDELPGEGRLNMSGAEARERQRAKVAEKSKEKDEQAKARAREKEKEMVVAEKAKKLQSSGAAREKNLSIASHAKNWAEVETGETSGGKSWGGGRSKRIAQSE